MDRVPRWCAVMRTWLRIASRRTRNALGAVRTIAAETMAQIWDGGEKRVTFLTREPAQGLVPAPGIEPGTFGLQNRCSTV